MHNLASSLIFECLAVWNRKPIQKPDSEKPLVYVVTTTECLGIGILPRLGMLMWGREKRLSGGSEEVVSKAPAFLRVESIFRSPLRKEYSVSSQELAIRDGQGEVVVYCRPRGGRIEWLVLGKQVDRKGGVGGNASYNIRLVSRARLGPVAKSPVPVRLLAERLKPYPFKKSSGSRNIRARTLLFEHGDLALILAATAALAAGGADYGQDGQ
jgi:hypothetical protein